MLSYNKEQAIGDDHNVLAVVMSEQRVSLDEAVQWLAHKHRVHAENALQVLSELRAMKFSPQVDESLAIYLTFLMNWPRALDCWSFECERYFGPDSLRVQKERIVTLYPKRWINSSP